MSALAERWPPLVKIAVSGERAVLSCSSCGTLDDGYAKRDGRRDPLAPGRRRTPAGVERLQRAAREHAWQEHDGHVDAEGWAR